MTVCTRLRWPTLALVATSALILALRPAWSQLAVTPPIREITVPAGGSVTFPLVVANAGEEPMACEMGADDMALSPEGRPQAAPPGYGRGCSGWLRLTPARFSLAPAAQQRVDCTLRAPRTAIGGYYARLRCVGTPSRGPEAAPGGSITLRFQLSCALLATVTGGRLFSHLEVRSAEIALGPPPDGWAARVTLANPGNVHVTAEGQVALLSERGQVMGQSVLQAGRGYVLAEGERVFRASGPERLPDGVYVLRATLSRGGRRVAETMQPFAVHEGHAAPGEPTPELRALIEASRPLYVLQPDALHLTLAAGGRRSSVVRVMNLTGEALNLEAEVLPWSLDSEGNVTFAALLSQDRFLGGGITASPSVLTIPPNAARALSVTLALPREARGEYYAAVAFKPGGSTLPAEQQLLAERALLVSAVAANTTELKAQVLELDLRQLEGGRYEFRIAVENTGNARCYAHGQIEVVKGAETVDRLRFGGPEASIMPGCRREFAVSWPRVLEPGTYQALTAVTYAEG